MDDIYPDRPRAAEDYAARRRERQAERKLATRRARSARARQSALLCGGAVAAVLVVWLIAIFALSAAPLGRAGRLEADAHRIVAQVDAVLSRGGGADAAERARGIAERVPAARELLDRAVAEFDRANPVVSFVWRPAHRLGIRARAERAMLEPAPALLEIVAQSASARPLARQGWKSVLSAEADTSSTIVPKGERTDKNLTAAVRAADGVSNDLTLARERFAAAELAFPAAGIESYVDYVGILQRANRARRHESEARLDGRKADAKDALKTATQLERRAAELRDKLPATVDAAIEQGVVDAGAQRRKIYGAASKRAAQASP